MTFSLSLPNENIYPVRWISTNGIWELGTWPVLFGVRIRMGKVGAFGPVLDYCAGADTDFQRELLLSIMMALIPVDENISEDELYKLFPKWKVRPINADPCWPIIKKMGEDGITWLEKK